MAYNNYVFGQSPNAVLAVPTADVYDLGGIPLVYNVNTTVTSGAYPYMLATRVYNNLFITADSWGDATVSIQVSLDGVKNWTPLNDFNGAPITGISANTYFNIEFSQVWIRAVVTSTTGVNISAVIC